MSRSGAVAVEVTCGTPPRNGTVVVEDTCGTPVPVRDDCGSRAGRIVKSSEKQRIVEAYFRSTDKKDEEETNMLIDLVTTMIRYNSSTKDICSCLADVGESAASCERLCALLVSPPSSEDKTAKSTVVGDENGDPSFQNEEKNKTAMANSTSVKSKEHAHVDEETVFIRDACARTSTLLAKRYPEISQASWGLDFSHVELSSHMCALLNEPKEGKMCRAVERLGNAEAVAYLRKALSVHEAGGLWYADKSRKRSVGGVFWRILQKGVSKDDYKVITAEERKLKNRRRNEMKSHGTVRRRKIRRISGGLGGPTRAEQRIERHNKHRRPLSSKNAGRERRLLATKERQRRNREERRLRHRVKDSSGRGRKSEGADAM